MLNSLAMLGFPAILAWAAVSDMMTMRISNIIPLLLVLFFVILAILVGLPLATIGVHFLVAFVVLLITFGLFAAGWVGGGDAKLAAAVALWFGYPLSINFLLTAAIFGGGLTLAFLLLRRWPLPAGLLGVEWITRLHNQSNGVPYGIALAAAGMMVYAETAIFVALSV